MTRNHVWYISLILLAALPCLLIMFFMEPVSSDEIEAEKSKYIADWANQEVIKNITYIQDHRNNLCFARYMAGRDEYAIGGITLVPCEVVKGMLLNP